MGEVVEGLGIPERERIAALRRAGTFFWVDASLTETTGGDLGRALDIPSPALGRLADFRSETPPSHKFFSDGKREAFAFSCFLESIGAAADQPLRPIEVHVLVCGDYLLTLHGEAVSLPRVLAPEAPEGRGEHTWSTRSSTRWSPPASTPSTRPS